MHFAGFNSNRASTSYKVAKFLECSPKRRVLGFFFFVFFLGGYSIGLPPLRLRTDRSNTADRSIPTALGAESW